MKMIIEEDNKIIQLNSKLKKVEDNSKKSEEIKEKIEESFTIIKNSVREMGINENEITKLAQKIQSMVNMQLMK